MPTGHEIPQDYRDNVHRLTVALLKAYSDPGAAARASDYYDQIVAAQSNRKDR